MLHKTTLLVGICWITFVYVLRVCQYNAIQIIYIMQVSALIFFYPALLFEQSDRIVCTPKRKKISPKFYILMCLGFVLKIQVLIANMLLLMKHQFF